MIGKLKEFQSKKSRIKLLVSLANINRILKNNQMANIGYIQTHMYREVSANISSNVF